MPTLEIPPSSSIGMHPHWKALVTALYISWEQSLIVASEWAVRIRIDSVKQRITRPTSTLLYRHKDGDLISTIMICCFLRVWCLFCNRKNRLRFQHSSQSHCILLSCRFVAKMQKYDYLDRLCPRKRCSRSLFYSHWVQYKQSNSDSNMCSFPDY